MQHVNGATTSTRSGVRYALVDPEKLGVQDAWSNKNWLRTCEVLVQGFLGGRHTVRVPICLHILKAHPMGPTPHEYNPGWPPQIGDRKHLHSTNYIDV